MRGWLMLGAGAVFGAISLGGAALAVAQPAPPPPAAEAEAGPGAPGARPDGPPPPPERGPGDRRRGMMMHGLHHPPPPTPGSSFVFRRGDTAVRIQCSDKEPVRACVDAANALFDKFNAIPR